MTTTPVRYSFWGGHYPPLATTFWHGHFPEPGASLVLANITPTQALVGAQGLVGVALLALVIEDGATVTFTFPTNVIKFRSGKEQRVSGRDYPKQVYKGNVTLVGDDVRTLRGQLARFQALGLPFQLALPHEETTITSTSSGQVIAVGSTSSLDWAIPGQTIQVINDSGGRVAAVVQSKTSTAINVDVALGAVGVVGARVMPTVPVYLDAQQGFERYPPVDGVEVWQINARAIQPGFTSAAVAAVLALSTVSTSGVLAGLVLVWNVAGAAGNAATVQFQSATLGVGVNILITEGAGTMLVQYRTAVCTVQNLVDALAAATSQLTMWGTYNPADTLNQVGDTFGPTHLSGGFDGAAAPVGVGASVTTYDGRSVWDRGVMIDQATAMDSVHALTELVDLGGTPYNPADGTIADWGRQVSVTSDSTTEYQWLKAMLAAIRGPQVAFWLPSWRNDLRSSSVAAGAVAAAAMLLFSTFSTGNARGVVATAASTGTVGNGWRVVLVNTGHAADNAGTIVVGLGLTFTLSYVAGVTTIAQAIAAFATTGVVTLGGTAGNATTITKTGGGTAWNAGASSVQSLSGDGYVEVLLDSTVTTDQFFGLSITDPDQAFGTIKYAFYTNSGVNLNVYDNFATTTVAFSYINGDLARIRRTGTTITYERVRAGVTTVLYTSLVTASAALIVDTSFDEVGAKQINLRLNDNGLDVAVTYQNVVNVSVVSTANAARLTASDAGNALMSGGAAAVGAVISIPQDAAHGDFAAWSAQRDRLRVVQTDGTITYTKILSVFVDGTHSTFNLSVDATLSGVAIASISWLELVRLEGEDVVVTFQKATFSMSQQARVVQQ